ncbi:hypothetical protein Tco_1371296 [Tanacetum coccineum]
MDTLKQQLTKETILESNCHNAFRVLKTQFEKIFTFVLIKPSSLDGTYAKKDFHAYTGMEPVNTNKPVPSSIAPEEPGYSKVFGYKYQAISHVISFKEEIAKYEFETTKSQVPGVRSPSFLQDHLAVVYSCEYHCEIMPQLNQMDYKCTKAYLPRIHRSKAMDEEVRESYRHLECHLFHEGRFITPSFIKANNMLPTFQAVGLEPFLTLDEPICP